MKSYDSPCCFEILRRTSKGVKANRNTESPEESRERGTTEAKDMGAQVGIHLFFSVKIPLHGVELIVAIL